MFSGKTSKLVQVYKQCRICDIPVIAINHINDIERNSDQGTNYLTNHDNIPIPCVCTNDLSFITNMVEKYQVILINEGQFFHDLIPFVKSQLVLKKQIYIAGLDGDFQRNVFGDLLQLIPLCDKVEKLTSLCGICKNGNSGIFSKRISREMTQMVVGGSDKYIPVCRICYETDIEENV
jgi:thymidine kinase